MKKLIDIVCSVLLVTALYACGGEGGGGNGGESGSKNKNLSDLLISEVSTCYFFNVDCWFEIHNPTSSAIDLSGYSIKSSSIDVTGTNPSITPFKLPSITIVPNGYVIISGNNSNTAQRGTQNIRLRSGDQVPFWGKSGFIELLRESATVDFVLFGKSTQSPVTADKWSGPPFPELASGESEYGKSIVRPYSKTSMLNTHTAADWISVDWVTPAGRNDIPAGTQDADVDGIPDSAEMPGGTFAGIDLYAMGARTGQKDIFIEVDSMVSDDPGIIPRRESLQKVVDSFAAKGIIVRFDVGTAFSPDFSVSNFNLGQGSSLVPYEPCVAFDQTTCSLNASTKRSIYDWKEEHMDLRRRSIFHYLLFGNSMRPDGSEGPTGQGEIIGNDFMLTMGNGRYTTVAGSKLNQLINVQASTVMHEFGHNLGLRHGGNDDINYKPNYWSVMNYLYATYGLDPDPTSSTAYQRWRREAFEWTRSPCDLAGSPCGDPAQFVISFSDGSSSPLNEEKLLEANNIGRGSKAGAYADWDLNGILTISSLKRDLNQDGYISILNDYNDWANLIFPFSRQSNGNLMVLKVIKRFSHVNPVSSDRQEVSEETPPPHRSLLNVVTRQ